MKLHESARMARQDETAADLGQSTEHARPAPCRAARSAPLPMPSDRLNVQHGPTVKAEHPFGFGVQSTVSIFTPTNVQISGWNGPPAELG